MIHPDRKKMGGGGTAGAEMKTSALYNSPTQRKCNSSPNKCTHTVHIEKNQCLI